MNQWRNNKMNIKKLLLFVLILIAAFTFNHYYLGISVWAFIGVFLLAWLFFGFLVVLAMKFYKKKKGIAQSEDSYVFPDFLSSVMKKVDMRTQYEASLLSISFILIGLIAMAIYTVTFMEVSGWAKFMITFNMFWGFIFLSSFLVTNYQQYVSYMQTSKVMKEFENTPMGSEIITFAAPTPTLPPLPTKDSPLKEMKGGQKKHG